MAGGRRVSGAFQGRQIEIFRARPWLRTCHCVLSSYRIGRSTILSSENRTILFCTPQKRQSSAMTLNRGVFEWRCIGGKDDVESASRLQQSFALRLFTQALSMQTAKTVAFGTILIKVYLSEPTTNRGGDWFALRPVLRLPAKCVVHLQQFWFDTVRVCRSRHSVKFLQRSNPRRQFVFHPICCTE